VPLYYAALAPAYLVTKGQSIWSRFTAMRLVSALLGGIAAAFVYLLVAELLPRPRWPAVAAGLLVAFQPMFAFVSGVINNDAGVNALAAIGLYLAVRALRRGLTTRLAVALGATIVALPLAKGNGLFLLPPIAIALAVAAWRTRRGGGPIGRPLMALGVSLAAGVVLAVAFSAAFGHSADPTRPGWYAATGNTYPTLPGAEVQPSGAFSRPVEFAQYVWQVFLPPVAGMPDLRPGGGRLPPGYTAYIERGWASFGFVSISFPRWVYAVIVVVMLGLVALALVAWARHRAAVSRRRWELGLLLLAVVGVFAGTEIAYFAPGDPTVPEFGRYLFPVAGVIAGIAALATFGLGRRLAPALAAGLLTAMMGLFWASEFLAMSALYS
jgi:4-amino-4-deoxy-L-arabinose transferase-like glycosyltransferase